MTVADDTLGKTGETKADANDPKVGSADKYQNLSESGESTPALKKFERIKAEKDGLVLKQELDHLAHIAIAAPLVDAKRTASRSYSLIRKSRPSSLANLDVCMQSP